MKNLILYKIALMLIMCITLLQADKHIDEDYELETGDATKISTKTYIFNKGRFVINEYSQMPIKDKNGSIIEYDEVFSTISVYKPHTKKPYYAHVATKVDMLNVPYSFPYVVVQMTYFAARGHVYKLLFYDTSKKNVKEVQVINNIGDNKLQIGKDGKYYITRYEAQAGAECSACTYYDRVIYRFDGKRFKKFKTIKWGDKSKTIESEIWGITRDYQIMYR